MKNKYIHIFGETAFILAVGTTLAFSVVTTREINKVAQTDSPAATTPEQTPTPRPMEMPATTPSDPFETSTERIGINSVGITGTLESYDKENRTLRIRDRAGTVTSFRITDETTIEESGRPSNLGRLKRGDTVTVYTQSPTNSVELRKVDIKASEDESER